MEQTVISGKLEIGVTVEVERSSVSKALALLLSPKPNKCVASTLWMTQDQIYRHVEDMTW